MCPRKYPWRPFAYPVAFPVPPGAYVNMLTYGNPPILVVPPYIYTPGCYEVKFCGWLIGIYENTGGAIPLWSVSARWHEQLDGPFSGPRGNHVEFRQQARAAACAFNAYGRRMDRRYR